MKYALLVILFASAPAIADDVTATPYLHINAGDVEIRRGGPGLALGYTHEWLGVELDIDRHEHFYKDKDITSVPNACIPGVVGPCIDDDTDAWIFSASAVAFLPRTADTRWKFYGTAGAGLVYAWIHDAGRYDSDQTHAIANLSVGTIFQIKPWLGIRLDLRYFHAFVDESAPDGGYASDYDWGRLLLGVTFTPFTR